MPYIKKEGKWFLDNRDFSSDLLSDDELIRPNKILKKELR